jgi:murein DD-endopeptidase MepM/ murein hydrolase activator NlpD
MNLFKKDLTKNLILFLIILAVAGIFNLALADRAGAAADLAQKPKQVKTAASTTVYYLDYKLGVKKAYVSEAAYLAYGNKWSDIKTISQAELNKWPDLKLVKATGEESIYYIKGDKKTWIKSPSDFSRLGFNYGQVATIKKADFLSYQIADYSALGLAPSAGQTWVRAGGGSPGLLSVELDLASLKGAYLPVNSRHNLVTVFNFKAGAALVEVRRIILNIQGIFSPQVIEKIYLANESDYVLSQAVGLNDRQAMFSFADSPLIIAAGQTQRIKIYLDLKTYADFANHNLKVGISSPSDIQANVEINGKFPLISGEYKLTTGSLLGQAKIEEMALNAGNKLVIGSRGKVMGKFKVSETSNQEGMFVKKIILVNRGSARLTDLANFKLKDVNNNLLAQAVAMEGEAVIFSLNNYVINKGQDKTFLFSADVIGGENKTVNFNLYDFYANGDSYGYGLAFDQFDSDETYNISRESLSVLSLDPNPSRLVFSQQQGVVVGNFEIRNNNQRVKLANLNVNLEKSANAPNLNETVYLVNYNSGEVYSAADGSKLLNGVSLSFNGLVLGPGQTLGFGLVTNLPLACQNGDRYRIIISKIVYSYDNSSYFEDSLSLSGSYLSVSKSGLYIFPNNDESNRNHIKGQKNIKIASFILEASAGDNLNISQIALVKSGDSSGAVLYENGFSNLRLYIGGSRVGSKIDKPASSIYIFDNFNYGFRAGTRLELSLYADTERDLEASETQLNILNLAAKSQKSNIPSVIAGLNSVSRKVYFGDSRAEMEIFNGGSFAPGITDNNVGRFAISNSGAEEIRLDSLNIITTNDGFSYSLGFSNLAIVEAEQSRQLGLISRPVAGANKINFYNYMLRPGQTAEFTIRVSASEAVPVSGLEVYLSELKATGRKSGLDVLVVGVPTDKMTVNCTSNDSDSGAGDNIALAWPVDSRTITYHFHDFAYPFRGMAEHSGIDIDVDQGTPVKAAAAGVVVDLSDTHTNQYNYVTIDQGVGIKTIYGHLSQVDVKVGDIVASGQVIGLSGGLPGSIGSGPYTTGPHLHFGVNQNGQDVDPLGFLQ